ncbi:MAG: ABC transporter permease [Chloroflexi bacterium]|nr:ABC transporter permease [Chloroflexota bacterium]MCY4008946.1 ABC transporter permease [Anaerolineaceae bacterium]MCY4105831.1 ABC transporter permease [Chloroflexota bacterium]
MNANAPSLSDRLTQLDRRSISNFLLDYGIVIAFLVFYFLLAFSTEAFFTIRNQLNILDQAHQIGLIAIAGTVVIIAGGFDLSTGAIFAMSGVVAGLVARDWADVASIGAAAPYLGWIIGILVGTLLGLLNGVLVTFLRINTFVATLSTGLVFRGLALLITQADTVRVRDRVFSELARTNILGVRTTIYIWLGLALILTFVLIRTQFGRYVFAAGDNPEAARLSGINVNLVRTITFGISGFAAGIAGVISASKFLRAQSDNGQGLELISIAAVVVGGTSIMGGEGAIWRTFLGVMLLRLIENGFNLVQVENFYRSIFQGLIILFAVALDALRHRRS